MKRGYVINTPKTLLLKNSKESFSSEEGIAIGLGCLLGDASIKKTENRLQIEQSELSYVEWKRKLFQKHNLATQDVQVRKVERSLLDKKTGLTKPLTSYRFFSKSLFEDFHCFYKYKEEGDPTFNPNALPRRRKQFIPELLEWFKHPLALSIFYMDDGGVAENQPYFSTGEVTNKEVLLMQQVFKENFGLDSSLRLVDDHYKGILIRRKDCSKFLDLVQLYVSQVKQMERKLKISRS